MDLNLFEKLKKDIESNVTIKNFMKELSDSLNNLNPSKIQDDCKEIETNTNDFSQNNNIELENKLQENRKEGHLYLVTEDRNNEIYLWDFTDKPKHEFKEIISSDELLSVAKEGTMLQYINGKYELYSPHGYDMLSNEKNKDIK